MKNNFFLFFKSKIKINIKGRKIERFIKRLADNTLFARYRFECVLSQLCRRRFSSASKERFFFEA